MEGENLSLQRVLPSRREEQCVCSLVAVATGGVHALAHPFYRINKYFAVSAKTVTKALKPELETKAARRYITEVNVQQIKNGETVKVTDLTSGKDLTL